MATKPPKITEMIGSLVAAPSVSSVDEQWDMPNGPVLERLGQWVEDLGFRAEMMEVPGQPGKANLIATLGRGPGGLVLAGHSDTVPYDDGKWQSDPFELREADDRLYGLGTCDMKAFLALAVEAARAFRPGDLSTPLVILATADEESSMTGARALVDAGRPAARHAIIGEPTDMRPVHMHKGMMMDAIRVAGHSGHSSDPALGASALEGMHRVIAELLAWRDELGQRNREEAFHVPTPTINLGYIRGGDNPNRICAGCELGIDLRPLPGMDRRVLREEMRERLGRAIGNGGLEIDFEILFEGADPMHTPVDSAIVRAAEELSGHAPEAVDFSTEAPYFARLGMEVVVLGPGNIAQAHQPDEYLELSRIEPTVELLRGMIRRFCVDGAASG